MYLTTSDRIEYRLTIPWRESEIITCVEEWAGLGRRHLQHRGWWQKKNSQRPGKTLA